MSTMMKEPSRFVHSKMKIFRLYDSVVQSKLLLAFSLRYCTNAKALYIYIYIYIYTGPTWNGEKDTHKGLDSSDAEFAIDWRFE